MNKRLTILPLRCLVLLSILLFSCNNKPNQKLNHLIRILASEYNYEMQDTIASAYDTFRLVNNGALWHETCIFRFTNDSSTMHDYLDSVNKGIDFPSFAIDYGGPGMTLPEDSHELIMRLSPGRYGMICTIDNHMMAGMNKEFFVRDDKSDSTHKPQEDLLLTLSDTGFHFSKTVTAGKHLIKIVNAGPQYHEVDLIKMKEGKTKQDYLDWFHDRSKEPPGLPVGGSLDFIPGAECWLPITLDSGYYILSCMVPDIHTGKSHLDMGIIGAMMIQ